MWKGAGETPWFTWSLSCGRISRTKLYEDERLLYEAPAHSIKRVVKYQSPLKVTASCDHSGEIPSDRGRTDERSYFLTEGPSRAISSSFLLAHLRGKLLDEIGVYTGQALSSIHALRDTVSDP